MFVRVAIVVAGVLAATPSMMGEALADPMNADMARRFVAGKTFAYNCFDGTKGAGRIYSDGSVAGSIQLRGSGPMRFVTLPAGTLRVKGQSYCAALRGLPFEPCFNLDRSSERSFRGAVAGFNFAYCDFNRGNTRQAALRPNWRSRLSMQKPAAPLRLHATPSPATTETAEITD
jgi:hypothetical protein